MRAIRSNSFGIGLRSEHISELCNNAKYPELDFLELAPDNWMDIKGEKETYLENISQKYKLVAHGLSLSIGDSCPINKDYLYKVKHFIEKYNIDIYSDHLCYSRDKQGYLYELLPVPRYPENIDYLVSRVQQVQDILERTMVLENITWYHSYPDEIPEINFWLELLERSQCNMLLDINNVYVNSKNHGYDAQEYIKSIPSKQICYYHIAGHLNTDKFILDSHGALVDDNVLLLAQETYRHHGSRPLVLERDHNISSLEDLLQELIKIRQTVTTQKEQNE